MDAAKADLEAFFTTKPPARTGWDLPRCRIVEQSREHCVEANGQGTTFRIGFHLVEFACQTTARSRSGNQVAAILLVEDETWCEPRPACSITWLRVFTAHMASPWGAFHVGRVDMLLTDVVAGLGGRLVAEQLRLSQTCVCCS